MQPLAVPGTPAIPTETDSDNDNTHDVHSQVKRNICYIGDINNDKCWEYAGTNPCMPAVVPKDATVLAVVAFTPRRFVNVSTVNGKYPIEGCES